MSGGVRFTSRYRPVRFLVAALALFITLTLIASTAGAQDVPTQVEPALLAKVGPASQPCLAEVVGLTITVPEGFEENAPRPPGRGDGRP